METPQISVLQIAITFVLEDRFSKFKEFLFSYPTEIPNLASNWLFDQFQKLA